MDFAMSILSVIFKIDELVNNGVRNDVEYEDIIIEKDVEYAENLLSDLYYDKNIENPKGVVVNIHGGGWLVGDKKWRKGIGLHFAKNGFFTINVNYSLSPTTLYPECVRDIFKVFPFIESIAEKYNLDTDRIYVTGDSAGAHLAAVVGAIENNDEVLSRMGIEKPRIFASKLALFCGIYDFTRCVDKPGAAGLVKEMTGVLHSEYKDSFEFFKELSPINYVTSEYPSTYMVSTLGDIFCDGQSELMRAKFDECGVKYVEYITPHKKAMHCFHLNQRRKDSMEALNGAIEFFNDCEEKKESSGKSSEQALIV
ncbi:MAG: alpha/beta hydrolase [Clostridia bacterium]|jgi:acetyl esterase/lipase|nr:alpha/beta hydrolase [Clostridia bacterium]